MATVPLAWRVLFSLSPLSSSTRRRGNGVMSWPGETGLVSLKHLTSSWPGLVGETWEEQEAEGEVEAGGL